MAAGGQGQYAEPQPGQETDELLLRRLLSAFGRFYLEDDAGDNFQHDHEAPRNQDPEEAPHPSRATIEVDDLLNPTSRTRTLLEDGRVFGVEDGRHAKISIEGFRLFIHSLQSDLQILLLHSALLPMSDIVPQTPPCRVFLDLQWPDNGHRGRVIIYLFSNCSLSQQFLLLCTGQRRGLSYLNSTLLGVRNKGKEGEMVLGGIVISDEEREIAQLPQLNRRNTGKPYWKGDVSARTTNGSLNAQFAISTSDRSRQAKSGTVFGKVELGLEVLQNAARSQIITKIRVVDCGVIIPITTLIHK